MDARVDLRSCALLALVACTLSWGCSSSGSEGGAQATSGSDALSVCALASACAEPGRWSGLGQACAQTVTYAGVAQLQEDPDTSLLAFQSSTSCLSGKRTCEEFRECIEASDSLAAACEGRNGKDVCVGETLVKCTSDATRKPQIVDCAKVGLVCGQAGTHGSCGLSSCDPTRYAPSCDGTRKVTCSSAGVVETYDCGTWSEVSCASGGSSCALSMGGTCAVVNRVVTCQGTGAACDYAATKGMCDGTLLVSCRAGKKSIFDCASLGGVCEWATGPGTVTKCMLGDECRDSDDEVCVDDYGYGYASFCLLGKRVILDCKAMGFSGCVTTRSGERTVARCKL